MDEVLVDALLQFLRGADWRERVSSFVDDHCSAFGGAAEDEYSEGMYACYQQFRSMADDVIEGLLAELGCSSAEFIEVLERHDLARGPRDESARLLLADLVELDDFRSFAAMMRAREAELEAEETGIPIAEEEEEDDEEEEEEKDDAGRGGRQTRLRFALDRVLWAPQWQTQVDEALQLLGKTASEMQEGDLDLVPWARAVRDQEERLQLGEDARDGAVDVGFERLKAELTLAARAAEEQDEERRAIEALEELEPRLSEMLEASQTAQAEAQRAKQQCPAADRGVQAVFDHLSDQLVAGHLDRDPRLTWDVLQEATGVSDNVVLPKVVTWLLADVHLSELERMVAAQLATPEWSEEVDEESGATYYFEAVSGRSTWERPAEMPDYSITVASAAATAPASGPSAGRQLLAKIRAEMSLSSQSPEAPSPPPGQPPRTGRQLL